MKTKALISSAVTAKLICVFALSYAKCWFSHDVAHITISTQGHTSVARKTSMSERHSLLGLGSKAKQIVDNDFIYFHRESAADTSAI